uniref:Claudin-4 n=1 Tax=Dicentrarchus labrax TaxID=13489 RepID=A0A8C4GPK8_DICLA
MPSVGLEILGVTLAVLGWILAIVSCALPMWRVSAFIGMNIVTAQITWEGIWMNCVVQSTGQMQCKIHDSMLALSADLQAARALTIISILVGILGLLVAMMGAKCTNCVEEDFPTLNYLNCSPKQWTCFMSQGETGRAVNIGLQNATGVGAFLGRQSQPRRISRAFCRQTESLRPIKHNTVVR